MIDALKLCLTCWLSTVGPYWTVFCQYFLSYTFSRTGRQNYQFIPTSRAQGISPALFPSLRWSSSRPFSCKFYIHSVDRIIQNLVYHIGSWGWGKNIFISDHVRFLRYNESRNWGIKIVDDQCSDNF